MTELLVHGGVRELASPFEAALARFLRATPLTDLATAGRRTPPFAWTPETLALVRAPVARALALRAIATGPMDELDAAFGSATRALLAARAWREASTALDFLGHRVIAAAQESPTWPGAIDGPDDTAFARATGAIVARKWLDEGTLALSEAERRRLAALFDAATKVSAARDRGAHRAPRANAAAVRASPGAPEARKAGVESLNDREATTSEDSSSGDRRTYRTSPRASPARGTGGTPSAPCPRSAPSPRA